MESVSQLKNKTIKGVLWHSFQKASTQLLSFVISVVLARMLSPDDFGLVALTSIFLTVANVLADSGLGTSLVQKKEIDRLDVNTVFFFSLALSVLLYAVLFFIAPLVSRMYGQPALTDILRVLGLGLLLSSFNSVQSSLIQRRMDFKFFFYVSLISTVLSGVVGLWMAYAGYGCWALVGQGLTKIAASVITLYLIVRWLPRPEFSFTRLKGLYRFGLNYMGANLVGSIFNELRGFLIGLRYAPSDLAFFNRGDSIPSMLNGNVTGTVSSVLFSAVSKIQDQRDAVKQAMRRTMMATTFVVAPLLAILMGSSYQVIPALYSAKWGAAAPFMAVLALYYLFSVLGAVNLMAMNAIGRSDVTFKLEFVKKPVFLGILLYTMQISPMAIAVGNVIYALYGASVNALPNKKLIGYSYREQIGDIYQQILLALLVGVLVFALGRLGWNLWLTLVLQWVGGGALYLGLSALLRMESFRYVWQTAVGFLKNK